MEGSIQFSVKATSQNGKLQSRGQFTALFPESKPHTGMGSGNEPNHAQFQHASKWKLEKKLVLVVSVALQWNLINTLNSDSIKHNTIIVITMATAQPVSIQCVVFRGEGVLACSTSVWCVCVCGCVGVGGGCVGGYVGGWMGMVGWLVCVWEVWVDACGTCVWCVSVWVQEEKRGGGNLWFVVSSNLPMQDSISLLLSQHSM